MLISPYMIAGGGALGLLNYLEQKRNHPAAVRAAQAAREREAELERFSPWTKRHGERVENPGSPSLWSNVLQGVGTGTAMSPMVDIAYHLKSEEEKKAAEKAAAEKAAAEESVTEYTDVDEAPGNPYWNEEYGSLSRRHKQGPWRGDAWELGELNPYEDTARNYNAEYYKNLRRREYR